MKAVSHFGSFQEMYHFMNAKPEEPKEYVEEEKPKKKKGKKDGKVLQAD